MHMRTISNNFKVKDRTLLERFFNDIKGSNLITSIEENSHGIYGHFSCDSILEYRPDENIEEDANIIDDEIRWQMYINYIQNMLSDNSYYSIREILYTDIIESNIITITKEDTYSKTIIKGGIHYDLH